MCETSVVPWVSKVPFELSKRGDGGGPHSTFHNSRIMDKLTKWDPRYILEGHTNWNGHGYNFGTYSSWVSLGGAPKLHGGIGAFFCSARPPSQSPPWPSWPLMQAKALILPDRLGLGKLSGAKYPGPSNLPKPTSIPLHKLLRWRGK